MWQTKNATLSEEHPVAALQGQNRRNQLDFVPLDDFPVFPNPRLRRLYLNMKVGQREFNAVGFLI